MDSLWKKLGCKCLVNGEYLGKPLRTVIIFIKEKLAWTAISERLIFNFVCTERFSLKYDTNILQILFKSFKV